MNASDCPTFAFPLVPLRRPPMAATTAAVKMHISTPCRVTRRAAIAFLFSVPACVSAKVRLADPDALSRVVETDSGLRYFDIASPQSGPEVTSSSTVTLHYTLGTTGARNGWRIDSSYERDPLIVTIGRHEVIRGLEEGMVGMRPGGVRRLLISPNLGYHSERDRPIPNGFAEYQRFKNVYLNKNRPYQPDVVIDVTILKVR